MNFFGRTIEVEKAAGEFYAKLENIMSPILVKMYTTSLGVPLDEIIPMTHSLENTGFDGLIKRELVSHIVLDRVFHVGDMSIPTITDVDFGRRFRLSTYRENGEIWACAVQLEQAAFGIHYDLRVASNLTPSMIGRIPIPIRPRLVWQNDHEVVVAFIPLRFADRYLKLMRTDVTAAYVNKYLGQIESTVLAAWGLQSGH